MTAPSTVREPDAPQLVFGRRAAIDLSGRLLAGRYALRRRLGFGGSATIYEADDLELHRRVAVKILDPGLRDPGAVDRFVQEARAAASLRSEHIVDVFAFGRSADEGGRELVYMVMELLDGEDLAATLEHGGPLPWRRVLAIGAQVCRALIAAHASGVVHCDIKPGNCFRITR
ncbi:MAG TPA: serine/threonine-protein kinase, partial [Nannocystis sp.]